jgi:hypothetical protein
VYGFEESVVGLDVEDGALGNGWKFKRWRCGATLFAGVAF